MIRLGLMLSLFGLVLSCNNRDKQVSKKDHPELRSLKTLPKEIRIVGIVRELSQGYCGIFCQGGYIKVELQSHIPNFNFKSIYVITACLPLGVNAGVKVDVISTLHTVEETECYYQHFDKPQDSEQYVFYKLSETETAKVHY